MRLFVQDRFEGESKRLQAQLGAMAAALRDAEKTYVKKEVDSRVDVDKLHNEYTEKFRKQDEVSNEAVRK